MSLLSSGPQVRILSGRPHIEKNKMEKILGTYIADQFLSDEEIDYFKGLLTQYPELIFHNEAKLEHNLPEDWTGPLRSYFSVDDGSPQWNPAMEILNRRVTEHFGEGVIIGGAHILTARFPYGAHSDAVFGEYGIDENHYGAWTLVIPLDDYDSSTIVFEQHSGETKLVDVYAQGKEPLDSISEEFYNTHLTNCVKHWMRWLSVEAVFPWRRGQCLAMSRYKFHTSDDFYSHGIPVKQGLVLWTAVPHDFEPRINPKLRKF